MKRRKKIWIACAALAVVVALCVSALLYRPVPYRFMAGARYEKSEVASGSGTGPDLVAHWYTMQGTMDAVADKAKAELRAEDGWKIRVFPNGDVLFNLSDKHVKLEAGAIGRVAEKEGSSTEDGTVTVIVGSTATPLDRIWQWLYNR